MWPILKTLRKILIEIKIIIEAGEYELREIFDYEGWKDVKRPQALGRQVSSLVDEGRLKNI